MWMWLMKIVSLDSFILKIIDKGYFTSWLSTLLTEGKQDCIHPVHHIPTNPDFPRTSETLLSWQSEYVWCVHVWYDI